MRFRIPDIILGVMLTLAVLAIGVVVSPYVPLAAQIVKDTPEDRVAFFTLLLGVFTLILAVATIVLAVATYRALQLAQQEFTATHRPRVVVRLVTAPVATMTHLYTQVVVANIGDTPATVEAFKGVVYFRRNEAEVDVHAIGITPQQLQGGATANFEVQLPSGMTMLIFERPESSIAALIIMVAGTVRYRDLNGTVRETGFYRQWRQSVGRFVPIEGADNEYAD